MLKFPLSGISSRVRGKVSAALGLYGYLFVGSPTNTDAVVSGQPFGIFKTYGAPTNGTAGTYAGVATPGSLLVDVENAVLYQNTNTLLSPTWSGVSITGAAAITSGTIAGTTINSSTIGATTPAEGQFTFVGESAATGIVASVTHTLVGATALTHAINVVSTVANASDSVSLPALKVGESADVYNAGAHPATVYPSGAGIAIDGGGAGAAVTLTNGSRCRYTLVAANVIVSAQLGAVSS